MKCDCPRCDGAGEIVCPDCGGSGSHVISIQAAKLDESHPHYQELQELRNDAVRIMQQASALTKLRPERAATYADQRIACLNEINRQADKIYAIK